jgi:phenylalanyl-tRNA synthetase alpha chain
MKESELRVLKALKKDFQDARAVSAGSGVAYDALMSLASSLESQRFVEVKREAKEFITLTPEGKEYLARGTPEKRLADVLKPGKETPLKEALKKSGLSDKEQGIALQWIKQTGLAVLEKRGETNFLASLGNEKSEVEQALEKIGSAGCYASELSKDVVQVLRKRNLAAVKEEKGMLLRITDAGTRALHETGKSPVVTRLTPAMIASGEWKKAKLASYDLSTVVKPMAIGKKHFYKQLVDEVRGALVGLGFREVEGPLVELEFWNMDVLFMAQDHPAREVHDVFQPDLPLGKLPEKELVERVRWAHEEGGAGPSRGWRYRWSEDVARRTVLRSQMTAVTGKALSRGLKPPQRLFAIGKCLRPDKIDATHFIEFNQCEGIVVDESVTFRDLLGCLKVLATEVFNAREVRFVPSYYPFTEPSVDMVVELPGRGWVEVAGAGMFRPEMLEALQVEVPVLAWGIGIDRLAMLKLTDDIRDLHSTDIALLRRK